MSSRTDASIYIGTLPKVKAIKDSLKCAISFLFSSNGVVTAPFENSALGRTPTSGEETAFASN